MFYLEDMYTQYNTATLQHYNTTATVLKNTNRSLWWWILKWGIFDSRDIEESSKIVDGMM